MTDAMAYATSFSVGAAVLAFWWLIRKFGLRVMVIAVLAIVLFGTATWAAGWGVMEFISPGYSPSDPNLTPTLTTRLSCIPDGDPESGIPICAEASP